ncbi:MAG: hypothetical protein M3Z96_13445 [Pseudomonadota bacterium]|nr:hypothetical protein [Pseudomonadota bacterium]
MRDSLKIIDDGAPRIVGDLQDGVLAYYLSQAKLADANIEARLDKEPFDLDEYMRPGARGQRRREQG